MADQQTIPATFAEAKEAARQRMLHAQAAAQDDATQAETHTPDLIDDDDEPSSTVAPPSVEDEPDPSDDDPTDEDEDTDDEDADADDEEDESDDADDESDDDDDEPRAPVEQKQQRKPSRRSKRINKLQDEISRLKADSTNAEDRLLKRLQEEQARRAALEAEQRERDAEDRQNELEMSEYLGSDVEYRGAVKAALAGDAFEAEKARLWDERREIFGKLTRRAEARVNQKAAEIYWGVTQSLPGVDREILQKADFGTVLQHLHAAGSQIATTEARKELDKRDARIARLEAQLKAKKVKTAASTGNKAILEGGSPIRSAPAKSIYEQSMDPVTKKIDRDKFARLKAAAERSAG